MTEDQSRRLNDLITRLPTPEDMREMLVLVSEIEQTANAYLVSRIREALHNHNGPGYSG
jgi:hypothetical protein